MRTLPTRQVHLDFHTSPLIPNVGGKFDKAQFQQALKAGHINSITVFAKCHHGLCYFPTKVGTPHPTMPEGFDLTGAMIDAAHEIGVDAPVYITAGFSALDAEQHPEWSMRGKDGSVRVNNIDFNAAPDTPLPTCSWVHMCMSGEYAEHIYALTREICERYEKLDGLFFDIVYLGDTCYCPNCLKGMREEGLDPENIEDAREYYKRSHLRFMKKCTDILHEKHPDATVFFNSGGAEIYRPEYHDGQTHFEMEDLPTAWGGYDKMPERASFMGKYGKEILGMTGKFHTDWGEFGGYKNPEALKYEALLMAMYGAKVSTGDQMLPCGQLDMATYSLIGHAYATLEAVEDWCYPAQTTAKLGVYLSGSSASDQGLGNMLLEEKLDFSVVSPGDPLDRFDCLILPDSVKLAEDELARIRDFADKGGAVLLSGTSAMKDGKFALDTGADYVGKADFAVDYFMAGEKLPLPFGNAPFLCYEAAERAKLTDGEVIAQVYEPLFDRTYAHYCSHRNTPYGDAPAAHPACVKKGNVVWLAHPLFRLYHEWGAQLFREAAMRALRLIYTPAYEVKNLPSQGRTRLNMQREKNRYVFHAAYASPIRRGKITVIEDLPELHDIGVTIRVPETIRSVRLVPDGAELPFTAENGSVTFTIPKLCCHRAVELNY